MAAIDDIQDEIIEEFSIFDQWMDKYEYIIDLGNQLPELSEQHHSAEKLVPGCQSRVWLHAELRDEHIYFSADSDAIITKGIIALLIRVLSGQRTEHVSDADLYFIDKIGLKEHLSPTRSNGLVNMVQRIKSQARSLQQTH